MRPLPGIRSGVRRGLAGEHDSTPSAGRGIPLATAPLRASVRQRARRRNDRSHAIDRRSKHQALWASGVGSMTMQKPFAITLDVGSSLANHTGSWRTARPVYVTHLPPCNKECPAGEDIQGWLFHAESGDYETAWRHLVEHNPFPAIMGRVCYHTCESQCNRARVDAPVGINSGERFLGDDAIRLGWKFTLPETRSDKRVLIV